MRRIELPAGATLAERGATIGTVIFPERGVISCGIPASGDTCLEVGLVGREGFVGSALLLGAANHPHRAAVHVGDGRALAIDGKLLGEMVERDGRLRTVLQRYIHYFQEQMSCGIVSGMRDQAEARLARRLLLLHDRIDGDELAMTHSDLSEVLNVRRATVTDCLHILEGEHILACTRGRIVIRDRAKLEEAAGDTYGSAEAGYRSLIGDFGKSGQAGRNPALPVMPARQVAT